MSYGRKRACAHPGCPHTTTVGQFCDMHRKKDTRQRGNPIYWSPEWRRESKKFLASHRWCECDECKASSHPLPADTVDHRKEHGNDMILFWDQSNWRAMNHRCHAKRHIEEGGGFRSKND